MNQILVFGAGLSSYYLIQYLAKAVQTFDGQLTIADVSLENAQKKTQNYPHIKAIQADILNVEETEKIIRAADVVVSLLPASFQPHIAALCLKFGKHLLTASYLPEEIRRMDETAKMRNLIFLNELGLDPGIDHMSAMQLIHRIKSEGGEILSFKSYAGALIAPESDNNPWGYKFTWNPRNVVLAGQGTPVKFMENHQLKYLPYQQLFHHTDTIEIEGIGTFEAYANRDSLNYRKIYELDNIPTILRGTLRKKGFCKAWAVLVNLGLTESGFLIENTQDLTYRQWIESFLHGNTQKSLKKRIALQTHTTEYGEELQKLEWLGLLGYEKIGLAQGSPADILQHLLEAKWKLEEQDKDMIVMQHQITYKKGVNLYQVISNMVVIGEDREKTAIAKTVGLPLAIATKLIIQQKIPLKGVLLPTFPEIYVPILDELKEYGIDFVERNS